ncbi:Dna2-domain-containing protein [Fistulina hepatica ATCC 64428]|uniref:DNA replication ATP-dependent helicase/nuclease DNA2 n=1 Tax=Fistulina hepatica ATCC 64428 TaxID=1128425 RepID=A0A0D7A383_9AGAR|nr:Dna2-domain-containing protein [Fistulina hepatica ATCC 64428]
MPPKTPTAAEEAEFMNDLLSGIDDSFWSYAPSPDPSPKRKKTTATPQQSRTSRKRTLALSKSLPLPEKPQYPLSRVLSAESIDMAALFEGAEDWDWDDTLSDPATPKKPSPKKPTGAARETVNTTVQSLPRYIPAPCTRCVVESVSVMCDENGFEIKATSEHRLVFLRDHWVDTPVSKGDVVNVIGPFSSVRSSSSSVTLSISISSKNNIIVLHPDILITATALSNAPNCRRKPILSSLVRSTSDTTPALVWGNMLHEVMQSCFKEENWKEDQMKTKIDEVLHKGLPDLVKIDTTLEQARHELSQRAAGFTRFAGKYMSNLPKISRLAIDKVLDIEEDIWSPTFGLKGKLDVSVDAVLSTTDTIFKKPVLKRGPRPFEIKTGRATSVMEHRAQTMLYTLLAAERYGIEVPSGLLYYTQSDEVIAVPASPSEIRSLIGIRNELASYMARHLEDAVVPRSFLPPTIDDERICKRCYNLDTCMLYRKAVENVEDKTSAIADAYDLKTSHLSPPHCQFFKEWDALIAMEEQDLVRFKKELWTMGASRREEKGRCFARMCLDRSYTLEKTDQIGRSTRIHKYSCRFTRKANTHGPSLLTGHMSEGDAVTVSIAPRLLAIARGFITTLTPHEVVLGVDHDLDLDMLLTRLAILDPTNVPPRADDIEFRIDRDELFSGMGRIRDNLAQLFYSGGDKKRRELVVDLRKPVFDPLGELVPEVARHLYRLNDSQRLAVRKALAAQDYALVLGMPGTGKTTVIAALIKCLVSFNKTVLLASYTHSAVDNILLKLKDDCDFSILRLGNVDKVHPDVRQFTLTAQRVPTTIEQLEYQIMSPPVVATTCLSIDDFVRNPAARKGGMEVSLFRRLSQAHPDAVVDLAYQYRMNKDIMLLSNVLVYGNRLRCGSDEVAEQALILPNRALVNQLCTDMCWLEKLLAEDCKAIFVDTDALPARDLRVGDLVQNETEARLVCQLVEALLACGVREDQIGLITLYRQQIKLLAHRLHNHKDIEILTADRSQGRDKDCIIISMVRSNEDGQIGELLRDWRRINVSFTRARRKLVIFGSRRTLQTSQLLSEFFKLMDQQGWILPLDPNALTVHADLCEDITCLPKRSADEMTRDTSTANSIQTKRMKTKRLGADEGVVNGRPILRDLWMNSK